MVNKNSKLIVDSELLAKIKKLDFGIIIGFLIGISIGIGSSIGVLAIREYIKKRKEV